MPERTEFTEARPFVEADTITQGGRLRVQLISPGWGSSGFYSPDVLAEAATRRVFPAGTQMFLDHPGPGDRPERSVRDLAAVLTTDATLGEDGALVADAQTFGPFAGALTEMRDAIGLSIRANGFAEDGEADGRRGPIITGLDEAVSVDFVTKAGRGGRVLEVLESYATEIAEIQPPPPAEPEEQLALIDAAEAADPAPIAQEENMPDTTGADTAAPAGTSRALIEAELREQRRTVAQLQAANRARIIVTEVLSDAWLTPRVIGRISASLLEGPRLPLVDDQLDEAALRDSAKTARDEAELEAGEILETAGLGRPRGLAALNQAPVFAGKAEDTQGRLEESFRRLGMSEASAKTAAKGR